MVGGIRLRYSGKLVVLRPIEFAGVYNNSAHYGAVTAYEFRRRVNHDIRTVLDRTEAVRSCKRVVHDQRDSVTVGNSGDRLDIYHVGIRISERLRIYKLGVFLDRLFKILGIGRIDERNVKSLIAERMFKEVEGSAVEV